MILQEYLRNKYYDDTKFEEKTTTFSAFPCCFTFYMYMLLINIYV